MYLYKKLLWLNKYISMLGGALQNVPVHAKALHKFPCLNLPLHTVTHH